MSGICRLRRFCPVLLLESSGFSWDLPSSDVLVVFSRCEGRVLAKPGFSWEFSLEGRGVGVNVMYCDGGVIVLSLFIALLQSPSIHFNLNVFLCGG
jgi:hypothetical protein